MNQLPHTKSLWLTYHDVYQGTPLPGVPRYAARYHVSQQTFIEHLSILLRLGRRFMTASEFLHDQTTDSVVLTFDDGWRGAFAMALPVLQDLGVHATFFITRDFVRRQGFCDPALIRRAAKAGMEIGLHGTTHRMLSACTPVEVMWEFTACKAFLESLIEQPVEAASLPGGDWSPTIKACAKQAGLTSLSTIRPGLNDASTSPFHLRRVTIQDTTSARDIERYGRYQITPEWLRWAALQVPCRLLGKRTYSRVRQWLLDAQHSREDDVFIP